jgi:DNA-binding YbaB/EbfC family protein
MFKGLTGLGSIIKQAQQMSEQMGKLDAELRHRRASGSAGGGMVEIEVNGLMEVLKCKIDPTLITGGDCELIEDMVASAMNQAVANGRALHGEAMKKLTGGLEMPGLEEALAKLTGGGPPNPPDEPGPPDKP